MVIMSWMLGLVELTDSESTFPVVSIVEGMSVILVDFPHVDDYLIYLRAGYSDFQLDKDWPSLIVVSYYYVVLPDQEDEIIRLRTRLIMAKVGEDAATDSAAAALACYLSLQRGQSGHTYTYKIEQGVEMGRHSEIGVVVTFSEGGSFVKQVLLSGTLLA